jgi:hypothetical protein
MKIYKTQQEVEKDIKNSVLLIERDVKFECSISIEASIKVINGNINARDIKARDIKARNIKARDINALDINAWNINAWNIDALDINALDINAWNINAWNIDALDINAWNINAWNIDARNILYYAFCSVYQSIKCKSIKAKREVHSEPVCLDGKLEIKEEPEITELTMDEVATKFGIDVKNLKIKNNYAKNHY